MKMGGKLSSFAALLVIFVLHGSYAQEDRPSYQWDEHGYVLYCPCMGMVCLSSSSLNKQDMSLWNVLQYFTSAINIVKFEIENSEKLAVARKQAVNDSTLASVCCMVFILTLTPL